MQGAGDHHSPGTGNTTNFTQGQATKSRAEDRGVFVPRAKMNFRDILDGTANSIMMGELPTDLGDRDIRTVQTDNGQNSDRFDNPSWCALPAQNLIDTARHAFGVLGFLPNRDLVQEALDGRTSCQRLQASIRSFRRTERLAAKTIAAIQPWAPQVVATKAGAMS